MIEQHVERVTISNPFDRRARTRELLQLAEGAPLSAYLKDEQGEFICALNGQIIPPEGRDKIIPRLNDQIIVSPRIGGGGGDGKTILRSVLLIAASVLAIVFGGPLGIALGFSAASHIGAAIGSALILAAGMGLAAVIAPLPKLKSGDNSQTYGWNGPQLTARQGLPIQKGYGKFRSAGNVIASYVYTNNDKQWLNMLICLGFGPCVSITDIEINDNPIQNYGGSVHYEIRRGLNVQPVIQAFKDTYFERPQNVRIRTGDTPFIIQGDRDDAVMIEVEFFFPKGLWAGPNSDSSYDQWIVKGLVEYQRHVDGGAPLPWTPVINPRNTAVVSSTPYWVAISQEHHNTGAIDSPIVLATSDLAGDHEEGDYFESTVSVPVFDADGTSLGTQSQLMRGTWVRNPENPDSGGSPHGSPARTVTNWHQVSFEAGGNRPTVRRHVVRFWPGSPGKWDLRIRKIGSCQNFGDAPQNQEDSTRRGEECWIFSVREVVPDDFTYPNMVLLGIRALATDKLSGTAMNVTAMVDYGESNPSKVVQDMMTNTLYGGGIPAALLDTDKFAEWEAHCNDVISDGEGGLIKRATFNGIFDTVQNLWDAVTQVCAISRAAVMRTGLHYTVAIDKAGIFEQVFNVANILKDSFEENFLSLADRANTVDIAYNDAADRYKRKVLTVQDTAAIAAGDPVRRSPTLDALGITSAAQAYHEGYYRLLQVKYLKRTVSFQAPVEAIATQVGAIAKLQFDVPQWGMGGKLISAADATHLKLDRIVTMEDGKIYSCIVVHPDFPRFAGVVTTVVGQVVVIGGYIAEVHGVGSRLITQTGDYEIRSAAGANVTLVGSASAIKPGDGAEVHSIDVAETREVLAQVGSFDEIELTDALSFVPPSEANYTFGEVLKEGKDFRIVGIERDTDLLWTIHAVEYDDRLYPGDIDPIVPPAPPGEAFLINVQKLHLIQAAPGLIGISWTPGKYTVGARIYRKDLSVTGDGGLRVQRNSINLSGSYSLSPTKRYFVCMTWHYDVGGESAPSPIFDNGVQPAASGTYGLTLIPYPYPIPDHVDGYYIYLCEVPEGNVSNVPTAQGPIPPRSNGQVAGGSGILWTSPANIRTSDGIPASCVLLPGQGSDFLIGSNFPWAIPSNAIISGITVQIRCRNLNGQAGSIIRDVTVSLDQNSTGVGIDHAVPNHDWSRTGFEIRSFGGPNDKWGLTLTAATFNSGLGVRLAVRNIGSATGNAEVDYYSMRVDYLVPTRDNPATPEYSAFHRQVAYRSGVLQTNPLSYNNIVADTAQVRAYTAAGVAPPQTGSSLDPNPPTLVAKVERHHDHLLPVAGGRSYRITVVGFDVLDHSAPFQSAPSGEIYIGGAPDLPSNIQNFRCTTYSAPNVALDWSAVDDLKFAAYEIRYHWAFDGATWERATLDTTITNIATHTRTSAKGKGTYFIKVIDTDGDYSALAGIVVVGRSDTRSDTDPNPDPVKKGPGTRFWEGNPRLTIIDR